MANLSIIKDLCKSRNITLRELSERLNLSEPGLQRMLRVNSTKIETLEKTAQILEVPITMFFEEKPDLSQKPEAGINIEINDDFIAVAVSTFIYKIIRKHLNSNFSSSENDEPLLTAKHPKNVMPPP